MKWGGPNLLVHIKRQFFFAVLGGLGQFVIITRARFLLIRWVAAEHGSAIACGENVKFGIGYMVGRAHIRNARSIFWYTELWANSFALSSP
jgi:hypothetical protein